jgi:tRNA(Ile)-lysidine synthase
VEDPSNRSFIYRRNAVRHALLPKLELIQPGAIANLARSAKLLSESNHLLERLAQRDGAEILLTSKTVPLKIILKVKPLLALYLKDSAAANNVVRYWLDQLGLAMPSVERLQSWWLDLQRVRSDARLEFMHDGGVIRLWRGQLTYAALANQQDVLKASAGKWVFLPLPLRSKRLGLAAEWVEQAQLGGVIEYRLRKGGERFQKTARSATKTLKNLFQEQAIPPWQRQAPLLFIDNELVAVAGIGVNHPRLVASGKRVWPEWQACIL